MKERKNNNRGFTLIELIIYMGLISTLIVVFMDILSASFTTQRASETTSSVVQDGRFIYSRLAYDINRAESVSAPQNLGDASNSLALTIDGNSYTYAISVGNLRITGPSGSHVLNSNETTISDLTFQRIGNVGGKHTFRINYTIASRGSVNGRTETRTFQTAAGLR